MTEADILEVIVKNARLLCATWPHAAEERVIVFRRQLSALQDLRDGADG